MSGCISSTSLYASPYVGAGFGSDFIDFNQQSQVIKPGAFGFNVINKTHLSGTGLFGTIFGGVEREKNKLNFTIEGNANLSSTNFKSSNDEYINSNFSHVQYKMNKGLGLSFIAGYLISTPTMVYGRVGYANSQAKIITNDVSSKNLSQRLNGLRLGIGLRQQFFDTFLIRFEYGFTQYQKIQFNTLDSLNIVSKSTTIRPIQQQVELSWVAQFKV
jgi:outer membrane immunogenic protein